MLFHKILLLATTASMLGCVPVDAPTGQEAPLPTTTEISVRDDGFSPPVTHIVGERTVTWIWKGLREHNVTFEDGQGSSITRLAGTHQRTFNPGAGGLSDIRIGAPFIPRILITGRSAL